MPVTAGIPYSRATRAAWEAIPPASTTTAAALEQRGPGWACAGADKDFAAAQRPEFVRSADDPYRVLLFLRLGRGLFHEVAHPR